MSEVGKPHTKVTIKPEHDPIPEKVPAPATPEREPVETEKTPA
jgi:hypothetical protein